MAKIAVAGNWDIGWNVPIKEVESWNLMMRDFSVQDWSMFPVTGIRHSEWTEVNLQEYHSMEDILAAKKEYTHVYVEPRGDEELETFVHPENALYIFGSSNYRPSFGNRRADDKSVYIRTVQNKALLWPYHALAIVLYDRLKKTGAWETPAPISEPPWGIR